MMFMRIILIFQFVFKIAEIQDYVIKFVSDLQKVGGTPVSSTNKTARHDITEILMQVALNTIILTLT